MRSAGVILPILTVSLDLEAIVAELFRYIQHAFVVPSTTRPIDVGRQSDLQDSLRDAISRSLPSDRVRGIADAFIASISVRLKTTHFR